MKTSRSVRYSAVPVTAQQAKLVSDTLAAIDGTIDDRDIGLSRIYAAACVYWYNYVSASWGMEKSFDDFTELFLPRLISQGAVSDTQLESCAQHAFDQFYGA